MAYYDDGPKIALNKLQKSNNIAKLLDEESLVKIGNDVYKGYEIDESSRSEWSETVLKALEIAKQLMKKKSFPWENASNIKFPLIAQASIDYAARTMPEIIQNERIVKSVVVGKDVDGLKYAMANRVSTFMSYQLLEQSMGWEDGTDMLLQVLPVVGTVFKKTYYDEVEQYNCSEFCTPDKIVVNYDTQSLEKARRVTHLITLYDNDILSMQRSDLFLDIDLDELTGSLGGNTEDCDRGKEFLEQHCYIDLDGDGYKEPYIVTIHKETKKVLRIVNRFKEIKKDKSSGEVIKIFPIEYFTDFHFIRSPDGGFYSMGFGSLLLPLNKAINSLINLLIDSGVLNTMQGGLIGRGLRMKNGNLKFKMGEWQVLDAVGGDDIRKNIFPWPTKEPSGTLFSLLSLLMQVGKDLSSTTDVLSGKQDPQNVAQGSISQMIEQGTKVFVAINKRLYRSLKKEYRKLFDLNAKYLTQENYMNVLDDPDADVKKDFSSAGVDVIPVADPTVSTESQRISRAGVAQQLRTADPREADKLLLESMQLDKEVIERLLPPPDPNAQPAPEAQKLMAEVALLQAQVANLSAQATLTAEQNMMAQMKMAQDQRESEARIGEAAARSWKMQQDVVEGFKKLAIVQAKMTSEQEMKALNMMHQIDTDQAKMMLEAEKTKRDGDHQYEKMLREGVLKNKEIDSNRKNKGEAE